MPLFRWFFFACLLGPASAYAQEAADSQEAAPISRREALEKAQAHVNAASQKYRKTDYAGALIELRSAETLAAQVNDPSLPRIRFNIARCLEQLERWDEALTAYEAYNRLPDEPHRKERAWEAIQKLRKEVFGTLSLACDPPGTFVMVEGLTEGKASCPFKNDRVRPGTYAITARHPGFEDAQRSVTVEAGSAANVEITLERIPDAGGGPGIVMPVERPAAPPVKIWPWVTMGTGAVVAASGLIFTNLAASARDTAETLPPGTTRDDEVSTFETNRTLSFVMYGTGVALVATGVVLWLLDDGDPPAEGLAIRPSASGWAVTF